MCDIRREVHKPQVYRKSVVDFYFLFFCIVTEWAVEQLPKEAESWAQHQEPAPGQMPAETPQGHACFSLEMWSSIITAPASAIEAPATTWWAGTTVGMARPMLLASNKLKKKKERQKLIVHTRPILKCWVLTVIVERYFFVLLTFCTLYLHTFCSVRWSIYNFFSVQAHSK